ncbi:MAG: hypothetical protein KJ638_04940 [Chloroflexi bacterium]|nr:hypothetical protein [Chloroflexota bacterium]
MVTGIYNTSVRRVGEWRVASGEWQVASGEWRMASGEWRVESGEWRRNALAAVLGGGGRGGGWQHTASLI